MLKQGRGLWAVPLPGPYCLADDAPFFIQYIRGGDLIDAEHDPHLAAGIQQGGECQFKFLKKFLSFFL